MLHDSADRTVAVPSFGTLMKAYDYIVVGSGSAGSIVAARLSEERDVSVLLLEAGRRDDHPFMPMPIAFPKVATTKAYIWPYATEAEPGLNGRSLPIWRGKTLGGCSSINAMINVRGSRYDYELWRQQGLEGWGYADVLPYFRKLETSWRALSRDRGAGRQRSRGQARGSLSSPATGRGEPRAQGGAGP